MTFCRGLQKLLNLLKYIIFLFSVGNIEESKNLRGDFARGTTGSCKGLCKNHGEDFRAWRYIRANGRDASAGASL